MSNNCNKNARFMLKFLGHIGDLNQEEKIDYFVENSDNLLQFIGALPKTKKGGGGLSLPSKLFESILRFVIKNSNQDQKNLILKILYEEKDPGGLLEVFKDNQVLIFFAILLFILFTYVKKDGISNNGLSLNQISTNEGLTLNQTKTNEGLASLNSDYGRFDRYVDKNFKCKIGDTDLYTIENTGGGDCQFLSIAQGLYPNKIDFSDDVTNQRRLCSEAIEDVSLPLENLGAFVDTEIYTRNEALYRNFKRPFNKKNFIEDFKRAVLNRNYWGDSLTLILLSNVMDLQGFRTSGVDIFVNGNSICCFGTLIQSSEVQKPIILLELTGQIHYRLIIVKFRNKYYSYIDPRNRDLYDYVINRFPCKLQ